MDYYSTSYTAWDNRFTPWNFTENPGCVTGRCCVCLLGLRVGRYQHPHMQVRTRPDAQVENLDTQLTVD